MKHYFCPNCHRKIEIPDMVKQVKSDGGITIGCGNCRKGKVVIPNQNTN